jgi:hypothetical protein
VSVEIGRAEKLRKWLLESWPHPEILCGDILQRGPGRELRESPAAQAAITILEKHGWLAKLPAGAVVRDKPRKEAWRIVRPSHAV